VGAGDEAGDASGSGSKLVACIRVSYIGPFKFPGVEKTALEAVYRPRAQCPRLMRIRTATHLYAF